MRRLSEGDPGPTLRMDADDVRFRFPGDSSWGTEVVGREAHAAWLQRFVEVGIQIAADEVIVNGPPWRMTVCARGTSFLRSPSGEKVYENRYVLWGTVSWAQLRDYEVYEDTQKTKALDEYLAGR